jgi:hypothetical protein
MIDIRNLLTSEVLSVYSGKDGKCCCGCAGKYSYNSLHIAAGSKNRGYEVTRDEVNDRMICKVLNIVASAENIKIGDNNISTVVGNRLYIVYPLALNSGK